VYGGETGKRWDWGGVVVVVDRVEKRREGGHGMKQ
jgi:hypothetical protein